MSQKIREQWKTYGDLDFSLANGEVLLAIDIHSFEGISAVVTPLHQEHYRKPA